MTFQLVCTRSMERRFGGAGDVGCASLVPNPADARGSRPTRGNAGAQRVRLRRRRARRTRDGCCVGPVARSGIASRCRQSAGQRSRRLVVRPRLHDDAPHRSSCRNTSRAPSATVRQERGEREARRYEAEAEMSRAEIRTEVAVAWYDRLFASRTEQLQQSLEQEIAMQRRAARGAGEQRQGFGSRSAHRRRAA